MKRKKTRTYALCPRSGEPHAPHDWSASAFGVGDTIEYRCPGVELVARSPATGPVEGDDDEPMQHDPGLDRADTSRREVEWLRSRVASAEDAVERVLRGLRNPSVIAHVQAEEVLCAFLDEPRPAWHIGHRRDEEVNVGGVRMTGVPVEEALHFEGCSLDTDHDGPCMMRLPSEHYDPEPERPDEPPESVCPTCGNTVKAPAGTYACGRDQPAPVEPPEDWERRRAGSSPHYWWPGYLYGSERHDPAWSIFGELPHQRKDRRANEAFLRRELADCRAMQVAVNQTNTSALDQRDRLSNLLRRERKRAERYRKALEQLHRAHRQSRKAERSMGRTIGRLHAEREALARDAAEALEAERQNKLAAVRALRRAMRNAASALGSIVQGQSASTIAGARQHLFDALDAVIDPDDGGVH